MLCYDFSGYKQKNKMCSVYLESKLQQDRYGSGVFKCKSQKTVQRKYLQTSKQQTKYHWVF